MLFDVKNSDTDNSSSHSRDLMKQQQQEKNHQQSSSGEDTNNTNNRPSPFASAAPAPPAAPTAAAPLFSIHHHHTPSRPLFQVSEEHSTTTATRHQAPSLAGGRSTASQGPPPPLFQISGEDNSNNNATHSRSAVAAVTAEATSEAGQLAPLWNTSPAASSTTHDETHQAAGAAPLFSLNEHQQPPPSPLPPAPQQQQQQPLCKLSHSSSELISVGSSSASNSQSSFFTSPGTGGTTSSSYNQHRSSMNLNLLENVAHRSSSSFLSMTHSSASSPDFAAGEGCGNISFPTLHQVKQQSSLRRLNSAHSAAASDSNNNNRNLMTDKQRATLDRVTRLAARMSGVAVAVICGVPEQQNNEDDAPPVLSQYGMTEIAWRPQALRVLKPDPEVQRSSGLAFYEHIPLSRKQHRVGTLILMDRESRPSLSPNEREDLDDLAFLASQALSEGVSRSSSSADSSSCSTPRTSRLRRQVSNTSESYTPRSGRRRRRRQSREEQLEEKTQSVVEDDCATTDTATAMDQSAYSHDAAAAAPSLDYSQDDVADPSQCIIACTAHDLLTPLMGLQLSLSLLQEDAKFVRHLEEQPLQRESFWTAWQSTEVMFRMCQTTIDTLRANKAQEKEAKKRQSTIGGGSGTTTATIGTLPPPPVETEVCNLDVTVLLHSLQRLMDPIPKQVPLIMTLAALVPNQVPLITTKAPPTPTASNNSSIAATTTNSNSVDWNILRCALTVLSHACRVSGTTTTTTTASDSGESLPPRKPIQLRIAVDNDRLIVECHHDCPDTLDETDDDATPTSLALQSVAHQMQAVHEGRHGFERNKEEQSRAVFWFSVPVESSSLVSTMACKDDRVITLLPQSHINDASATGTSDHNHDLPALAPMTDNSEPATFRRCSTTPLPPPPGLLMTATTTTNQPPSLSPSFHQGRGLRRLRRSSTGSTNTLGSRRRTFHDMAGLRDDTSNHHNTMIMMMTHRKPSNNHVPLILPTMIKAQSTATTAPTFHPMAGHKRNYQYPATKRRAANPTTCSNTGTSTVTTTTPTTAQSAMAAAFQASLNNASTQFGGPDNRMMSYSILQEQEHQEKEKLQPFALTMNNTMCSSDRGHGSASTTRTSSSSGGGGLDRCLKDLMGSSARTSAAADEFPQRVRERLYSSNNRNSKPSLALPSSQPRERKALVIEDSLVIRKTVARALTKLGIQTVVQACDGLEGVARMQEDVFDITLCDFSMPNLGGIDCVKQYRQWEKDQLHMKRPKQYIVGMSAHASPNDIAQGLQVGMNEYHPKPLTIKRLTELLQSAPLQEARYELDRMWQRQHSQSMTLPSVTLPGASTTPKGNLFADFTNSTVSMLDALNTSGRSATSSYEEDTARLDSSSAKRPKTEALFSMITN